MNMPHDRILCALFATLRHKHGLVNLRSVFLISCLLFTLVSCYDEDLSGLDLGQTYFPVEIGRYVTYEVDSIWRDDPIGPIGSGQRNYILREVNESTFIDEAGREAIRVERRRQVNQNWVIKDVWSRVSADGVAEQYEENVILIKHNFPVWEGKMWEGHARTTPQSIRVYFKQENIPTNWDYTYVNVHQPYTVNGLNFDSTVTVLQVDRPAAFGVSVFSQEVYAKHIGMIHRKVTVYNVQQNPDDPNGRDTIGYDWEMRVIDFGP